MVCLSCVTSLGVSNAALWMQKFRSCCILAYECGYREEDMALMFTELCDKGACPIPASNVPQCMELACIVWETLEQSAKSVKRWSQGVATITLYISSFIPFARQS